MIGRKQEINLQVNQILDALLIAVAFWLSHAVRYYGHDLIFARLGRPQIDTIDDFYWIAAIAAPFTPIVLEFQGFYSHPLQKSGWQSLRQMTYALLYMGLIIGACVIFFRWKVESRFFLPLFGLSAAVFLLIKESAVRGYLKRKVATEGLRERVIFAGSPEAIDKMLASMPSDQKSLISVVGRVDLNAQPVSHLVELMHEKAAERVVFSTSRVYFDKLEEAIHACELEGVEAWMAADFVQTSIARPHFDLMGGRPMIVFRSTPEISWGLFLKDVIDRLGALVLFLLSLPVWVVAAIGIKLSSPGPVFFRQMRCGRHGKPFRMLKFRTMHMDAEIRRAELEGQNQMSGPVFKIDEDPRVFLFGRLLRRWSIDEFPQFLNVLSGQMSLVGPRPLPVYEIEKIEDSAQRRRLSVKPGLTCLWQVSGRNRITSFEEWVALDLKYIDNWSIWLDISILLRTVPAVILGWGAR